MEKGIKRALPQSHLRSTAPSSEGAIRLRVADNKCMAGRPTKRHLCQTSCVRAMPENEKTPTMRVDSYYYSKNCIILYLLQFICDKMLRRYIIIQFYCTCR